MSSPVLTPGTPEATIVQAVQFLAGRCNYAMSLDGAGFNRYDAEFGHSIADKSFLYRLSPAQLRAIHKVMGKYQAQLAQAGITLPTQAELETSLLATPSSSLVPPPAGTLDLDPGTGQVLVTFPYDPAKVEQVKAIRAKFGGSWDSFSKVWKLNATATMALLEAFPTFAQTQTLKDHLAALEAAARAAQEEQDLAKAQQQSFISGLHQAVGDLEAPLPGGRILFAHQRTGIEHLLDATLSRHGDIVADDMGLGKTTTALVVAKAYGVRVLVIAPITLKDNWLREAAEVGVQIEVHSWAKIPEPPSSTDFVLLADEAHKAQTWGTYRYDQKAGKVVLKGTRRTADFLRLAASEHCLACYPITGTPLKNGRPANLFPLLVSIGHPLGQNKRAYEARYCGAHATAYSMWDITGATNLDELHQATKDAILRRTKAQCLDLPQKMRRFIPVELSSQAEARYNQKLITLSAEHEARVAAKIAELVEAGLDVYQAEEKARQGETLVTLGQYRMAGAVAKAEPALDMVRELVEQGQQVVCFTEFVEAAHLVADTLATEGTQAEVLSGAVAQKERDPMVQRFQAGATQVLVCTGQAGGVGITLTAAQTVILLDRPWTPGDAIQSEDRCHRIGQTGTVSCYWLQYGTIDEKVDDILTAKAARIDLVLKGARKTLRGVSSPHAIAADLLGEALAEAAAKAKKVRASQDLDRETGHEVY